MQAILQTFAEDRDVQSVIAGLKSGMKEQLLSGLVGSSRQVMIAAMKQTIDQPILIVAHSLFAAQKIAEDLQDALTMDEVIMLPANEMIIADSVGMNPDLLAQRIDALTRIANGFRGIVVTSYGGVRKLMPTADVFREAAIQIEVGQLLPMDNLLIKMVHNGYERQEKVEKQGEFSVRGGIVDFYPLGSDFAYRAEWFGDEIDSIRTFDPSTQRSLDKVESLTILPAQELIADDRRLHAAADHVASLLQEQLTKMSDRQAKQRLQAYISREIEELRQGIRFAGIFKYSSFLYPERQTLLDYMPADTILVLDEAVRLIETSKQVERDEAQALTAMIEQGQAFSGIVLGKSYETLLHYTKFPKLYLSLFLRQIPQTQPQNIVNYTCRQMQNFHGQMNVLKAEMERWTKNKYDVYLLANGTERADRLRRVLEDYKIPVPTIIEGNLQTGFEFPARHLAVITESEVFSNKQRKAHKTERKLENAERIKSYLDLKVGDYVVHINHGIGKYVGIGTLVVDGIHKDYMHVQYAGGDKLSVPIDQIHLIQKYVGSEEKEPKIYKLGGSDWQRAKTKARSSVKDIAQDLIKLYAERQQAPGFSFSKDTPYQREFEAMFPYEETNDQIRSIEEIKQDMEKAVPMDRLLCGDVGYGKTEVAIRAAFKAAIEGKQVAVLVPTTILAQQHFETFKERFSGYPFKIEVLSRFRSKKEQTETMKGIKAGTVDVVIGTHRLLSQDVQFKDLGLVIVDEEQRFGVSHKEKLKRLKTNIDVLTLTATPIPRTLHMSMLGVRDLSVIETPPENRFPVQTYVVEHSNWLVRDAIERELARGGQVFYLFNRVQGIYQMAEQINALVPDAKVAVAHGQMSEQELEKTILDFLDGESDVLVSTTIIETGVDIPNTNTLIVHDADKMGLSQLYQLRGRVGRSNRIAYAYFTYQKDKVLNEVAEKRLGAIREFTELGSGFKIAMRDLSIRGAGNLLGAEQHGFIASVGFDMYAQMLSEEMENSKAIFHGQSPKVIEEVETAIEMPIDAYIPPEYIFDDMQKIEIYKKVATIRSIAEADDLVDELIDRFGDMPLAVENLLSIARVKSLCRAFGIETVSYKKGDLILKPDKRQTHRIDGLKLFEMCSNLYKDQVKLINGIDIQICLLGKGKSMEEQVAGLEQFLMKYGEVVKPEGEKKHAEKLEA